MIIELTQKEVTSAIAEYVGNQMMQKQGIKGYTSVVPDGTVKDAQKVTVSLIYDSSKDEGSRVTAKVELL